MHGWSRPVDCYSARAFSDQPPGTAFWYENSNGLAEIAVNQRRADRELNLAIGSSVEIVE
jgi:S-adenosyl-L-methionine hydrolase (adenosine-forming)